MVGRGFNASIAFHERYLAWGLANGENCWSREVLAVQKCFIGIIFCILKSMFIYFYVHESFCNKLHDASNLQDIHPSSSWGSTLHFLYTTPQPAFHPWPHQCVKVPESLIEVPEPNQREPTKFQAIVLVRDDWLISNSSWINASFWQGMSSCHLPMATSQGEGFGLDLELPTRSCSHEILHREYALYHVFHRKIEGDLTNRPPSKLLELLDTQV